MNVCWTSIALCTLVGHGGGLGDDFSPDDGVVGFISYYLSGPLPDILRHYTVNVYVQKRTTWDNWKSCHGTDVFLMLVERFLKSTVPINVNVSSYHSFKALNAGVSELLDVETWKVLMMIFS